MEEDIYVNVERATKPVDPRPSTNQTGSNGSKRFHGAVVLCLGLLSVCLLAGLVGLTIRSAEVSALKDKLTERLQASDDAFSSLTEEKDLLNVSLVNRTQERDLLNARLINMTIEVNRPKTCPVGWKMFHHSCYLLSEKSDSWENGRTDCRDRGADLLVIDSAKEQEFLYSFTEGLIKAWIGLTDRVEEGTWKWINGAPLSLKYWWGPHQPDNGGGLPKFGEEDCAHIMTNWEDSNNWNDMSCNNHLRWICEKMV